MKASELRSRSIEELKTEIKNLKEKHYRIRFKKAVDVIVDPGELRSLRKDVSRILTVLNEKQGKEGGVREEEKSKGKTVDPGKT